jgi:hypothetical protein
VPDGAGFDLEQKDYEGERMICLRRMCWQTAPAWRRSVTSRRLDMGGFGDGIDLACRVEPELADDLIVNEGNPDLDRR